MIQYDYSVLYNEDENSFPESSREWLLTFNNPEKHGVSLDMIEGVLLDGAKVRYFCMSEEIGLNEHTPHIHLYCIWQSAMRFTTLKNKFSSAHIDYPQGTPQQCRDYVFKEGKWLDDPKGESNIRESHREYGDCPIHRPGKRNDLSGLYDMIKEGKSDYEIFEADPAYINQVDRIAKVRKTVTEEKYKNVWRDVDVTYIWGMTGTGKTRSIMEKYGYSNVYRVTDYLHPFDSYKGQDVVLFEEFRSSLRLDDMLKYLDGYPVELACRYSNCYAQFTKVYFCTNIDLRDQYPNIQKDEPMSWAAFLRRINRVKVFKGVNERGENEIVIVDTPSYMQDMHLFFNGSPFDSSDAPFVSPDPFQMSFA